MTPGAESRKKNWPEREKGGYELEALAFITLVLAQPYDAAIGLRLEICIPLLAVILRRSFADLANRTNASHVERLVWPQDLHTEVMR